MSCVQLGERTLPQKVSLPLDVKFTLGRILAIDIVRNGKVDLRVSCRPFEIASIIAHGMHMRQS